MKFVVVEYGAKGYIAFVLEPNGRPKIFASEIEAKVWSENFCAWNFKVVKLD
jgi:hypothetical protein